VVSGSVLVAVGGPDTSTRVVLAAWAFVMITYWLTHVYVHATESQFHGDTQPVWTRSVAAARAEIAVLIGGIPGITAFLIASATEGQTVSAEKVGLYVTVVILAGVGYLGARAAHLSTPAAIADATGGALLGLLLVAAKTALH